MITYALRCKPLDHAFGGWFRSSDDYDRQEAGRLVSCPVCGSNEVEKTLMTPSVAGAASGSAEAGAPPAPSDAAAAAFGKLQAMTRELRARSEYVGGSFAEEARRIHYGESRVRGIYGEATPPEVRGLAEEGIRAMPLPPLPEDKN